MLDSACDIIDKKIINDTTNTAKKPATNASVNIINDMSDVFINVCDDSCDDECIDENGFTVEVHRTSHSQNVCIENNAKQKCHKRKSRSATVDKNVVSSNDTKAKCNCASADATDLPTGADLETALPSAGDVVSGGLGFVEEQACGENDVCDNAYTNTHTVSISTFQLIDKKDTKIQSGCNNGFKCGRHGSYNAM